MMIGHLLLISESSAEHTGDMPRGDKPKKEKKKPKKK
jgi:hypothetical protein